MVPPLDSSVAHAQWRLIRAVLIGGALGLVCRYRAVRYGMGIPILVVAVAAIYAQVIGSHFPQRTALGEVHASTYQFTQQVSAWVTGGAVAVLAAAVALWSLSSSENSVAAIVGPVLGVGFLLYLFYLVGFDHAPDHAITLNPLHRARVWIVAAPAGSVAAFVLKTGYDHRPGRSVPGPGPAL